VTEGWTQLKALTDTSRRALYDYVRRQPHPVSRDDAAEATGMTRGLAAFHLDKLVDVGLLAARYEAPRQRPRGRGRTPKVYQLNGDGVAFTLPARRYELIADILAEAMSSPTQPPTAVAAEVAYRRGLEFATAAGAPTADLTDVLEHLGFEPQPGTEAILLHNCPFHALATRYTALVCGLNQALVSGVIRGCGSARAEARLVPRPGACCVEIRLPPH
jgi:predicted ArsR family transcriptional regulator